MNNYKIQNTCNNCEHRFIGTEVDLNIYILSCNADGSAPKEDSLLFLDWERKHVVDEWGVCDLYKKEGDSEEGTVQEIDKRTEEPDAQGTRCTQSQASGEPGAAASGTGQG